MRRKAADNERTYYPCTVEKKTAAAYTAQSTVKRINAQLDQYVELFWGGGDFRWQIPSIQML